MGKKGIWNGQTSGYVVHPNSTEIIICFKSSRFFGSNWMWFESRKDAQEYSNKLFNKLFPNGRIIIADKF